MTALEYHEATKHAVGRYARSLGYLEWASQPDPFRRFAGAPPVLLARELPEINVGYAALFDGRAAPAALDDRSVSAFLRYALGLSAWKSHGGSRWALRINPSSGNLHPTEAYLIRSGVVAHYAPLEHALETRAVLDESVWAHVVGPDAFLVGLTSIHWRESWKYGERAFRYCQHDIGHALGALRLSAARLGWRLTLQPGWSDVQLGALLGLDRDADFAEAEREHPACLVLVETVPSFGIGASVAPEPLVEAARGADWTGHANRLSRSHVDWPVIDNVAEVTLAPGGVSPDVQVVAVGPSAGEDSGPKADAVLLRRRSALGYDTRGGLGRDAFVSMLRRLCPDKVPVPWDLLHWRPLVQLLLFVHRVVDLAPGIYVCLRDEHVRAALAGAMRPSFLWERAEAGPDVHLYLLTPLDARALAAGLSCGQDIAGDGFFSLGMLAPCGSAVDERGDWFYRRLFWECGLIGQVLYLEAEAIGARGTGIGCFFDDAVHDAVGLRGPAWQSLYHFSMGLPVDDGRLTTEPGYQWEHDRVR